MDRDRFLRLSARIARWGQDYLAGLRDRPVRARTRPGEIAARLPKAPPETPEDFDTILDDFERIVPDGLTHWQHPRFFAYFPSNAAPASVLAEQLAASIAVNTMLWQTSPAGTEIETVMVDWLRQALGLPDRFQGVIQDTASTTTLAAVLTMRERALGWQGLQRGMAGGPVLRIYASDQVHSSIDKAVRLAGIGQENLVRVPTGPDFGMDPAALERAIAADRRAGRVPAGVIVCVGGTGIGASDPVAEVIAVARANDLYTHVDAAWAGSAMICPEFRPLWAGVEEADSIVFNPHKWLGAQFDCSVQFLADPAPQIRTLGLRPAYLRGPEDERIVNYNEWSLPLGRRFRALKLWFLIRAEGLDGLRRRIRDHVAWVRELEQEIAAIPGFRIVTGSRLALFTFQYAPAGQDAGGATAELLQRINDDGRIYLTPTEHRGQTVIRMTAGSFQTTRDDVMMVADVLRDLTGQG